MSKEIVENSGMSVCITVVMVIIVVTVIGHINALN